MITKSNLKFEECIGRGSFAVVHRGTWQGKEVALRLPSGLDADSLQNIQEINILRYNYYYAGIGCLYIF